MGFALIPLLVLSFFIALMAIELNRSQDILPSSIAVQAAQDGQTFVSYRDAVMLYQQNNAGPSPPAFTGTVPTASLITNGYTFPATFSNAITPTGSGGYVVTCYAALSTGAITEALKTSGNDASLGIASGGNWTSAAQGAVQTPVSLSPVVVPNGDIVSVVQIGN